MPYGYFMEEVTTELLYSRLPPTIYREFVFPRHNPFRNSFKEQEPQIFYFSPPKNFLVALLMATFIINGIHYMPKDRHLTMNHSESGPLIVLIYHNDLLSIYII